MQQGLIVQPTGVRAGSFSIFSSQPPAATSGAAAGAAPHAAAPAAVPAPGQGLAPINGSVYTPRSPLPPEAAGIPTIPEGAVIARTPANAAAQASGTGAKPPVNRRSTPVSKLQVKPTNVCVNDSRAPDKLLISQFFSKNR